MRPEVYFDEAGKEKLPVTDTATEVDLSRRVLSGIANIPQLPECAKVAPHCLEMPTIGSISLSLTAVVLEVGCETQVGHVVLDDSSREIWLLMWVAHPEPLLMAAGNVQYRLRLCVPPGTKGEELSPRKQMHGR